MRFAPLAALAVLPACALAPPAFAQPCASLESGSTTATVPVPTLEQARRVPVTALFSDRTLEVRENTRTDGDVTTSLLIATRQGRSDVLASITKIGTTRPRRVSWYPPTGADRAFNARSTLDAMEHLYALLIRQDPRDRFIVGEARTTAGASSTGVSHASALSYVAALRNCAVHAAVQAGAPAMMWQVAAITPRPSRGAHGLVVSALVRDDARNTLPGQLTFGRGDHLGCYADVRKDGVGSCTLFDAHGHELHGDENEGATIVTYSGIVEPDRIVPPTTFVFNDSNAGARPRSRAGH